MWLIFISATQLTGRFMRPRPAAPARQISPPRGLKCDGRNRR